MGEGPDGEESYKLGPRVWGALVSDKGFRQGTDIVQFTI